MSGLQILGDQKQITKQFPQPVDDMSASSSIQSVSGETVQLYYSSTGTRTTDAGQAAGVAVTGQLANKNILDAGGGSIATLGDTSLSYTCTALTTERKFPIVNAEDSAIRNGTWLEKLTAITNGFSNGEFCVDYRSGTIYGVKTSTATQMTSTGYNVNQAQTGTTGALSTTMDITKIGGVAVIADDGAFTAGTSTGIVAMGFADETTTDSVSEGDIGAFRMTLDRRQIGAGHILDDAALGVGSSYVTPMAGFADEGSTDSVGEGDVGAVRMLLNRVLLTQPSDGTNHAGFNAAFTETLALAGNSMNVSGLCYGMDANTGTPILRAMQVCTDNDLTSTTPNVLLTGGVYKAALDTYTDNNATPIPTTANGVPIMAITSGASLTPIFDTAGHKGFVQLTNGTIEPVITAAATETLALATDYLTTAGLCYGIDADNASAPILAAMQVSVDNTTISATPNVLVTGGAYKAALDTYNDNDASPFHMNVDGTLLATVNGLAGSVAHSGTDAGNPIKVGGYATDSQIAAVTAADRTNQVFSLYGEIISRSHTYGSQSDRAEEIDPLDEHYVEEELIDDTNSGAATYYFPSSTGRAMGNFNNVSSHIVCSGGATVTFEAKTDDSTDWVDISKSGVDLNTGISGYASWVDRATIVDFDDLHVRNIRAKLVLADASSGEQIHWKLTAF